MRHSLAPELRIGERKKQEDALLKKEAELGISAAEGRKEDFFDQITPLVGPLKDYIKRRVRIAYLTLQVRTSVDTTGDILDQVVFTAYQNYARKAKDLTLEQWLYQIANDKLDNHIHSAESRDARRRSLEDLTKEKLKTLEEIPFKSDTEGESVLKDDLDELSYHQRDFTPPGYEETPEQELERAEQLTQILRALSRIPDRERTVFELFVIEGFSKQAVAKITHVNPDEVPRIAERVKQQVLDQIQPSDNRQQRERKAS